MIPLPLKVFLTGLASVFFFLGALLSIEVFVREQTPFWRGMKNSFEVCLAFVLLECWASLLWLIATE